jgi:preprotein translocase subunit SecY
MFGFWYNFVFATLIVVFTYFFIPQLLPTNKMSDDLKRSGGFIPGVRPGVKLRLFDKVSDYFSGSLFLALAVFPALL